VVLAGAGLLAVREGLEYGFNRGIVGPVALGYAPAHDRGHLLPEPCSGRAWPYGD